MIVRFKNLKAMQVKENKITKREDFEDFFEYVEDLKRATQHELAIKELESFVCDNLNNSYAYEELGDNFLSMRKLDAAEKSLKRAIMLDPISANAHYLLGFVYSCKQKWALSVAELELANNLHPNHPEILRCLGWSLFHYGENSQGLTVLMRSITIAPNDVLALTDYGVCLLNLKSYEKAYEVFDKILKLEPEHDHARECMKLCSFYLKSS